MKLKLSFSILLASCFTVFSFAQSNQNLENDTSPNDVVSKLKGKQFDMTTVNQPKSLNLDFIKNKSLSTDGFIPESKSDNLENGFTPHGSINSGFWGVLNSIENDDNIFFSTERDGTNFTVTTYDEDFHIDDNFSITIPASANHVALINHYSTQYFNSESTKEFMIYIHYFDSEIIGPEGQIWEVWIVDNYGEILGKVDGNAAFAKFDNDNNKVFYSFKMDSNEDITISSYNPSNFELINEYHIDSDLTNFYMGVPFDFVTVNGQEYLMVSHYESLFMDNMTLEVYPDNHLIVKLLDYDFEEVKEISLNINSLYDEEPFLIPMVEFGVFNAGEGKSYNITTDVFNSDADLEIVYGISYYHMMQDTEWFNYILAKEDGTIIDTLHEYIHDVKWDILPIDGFDNQIGFLYGDDPYNATKIGFFDIESWQIATTFDAMMLENDTFSDVFNRIPHQNTYHYLIALANWDKVDDTQLYGVINEYKSNGELYKRHQLPLSAVTELFEPILTSNILIPNMFTTENDDLYFTYAYQELVDGNRYYNLKIARDVENVLVEFRGDTEKGKLTGIALPEYDNGTDINKILGLLYSTASNSYVDFYKLPLINSLGIKDFNQASLVVYPNPTTGIFSINSSAPTQEIKIYNVAGMLVWSQKVNPTQTTVNISSLVKGIYFVQFKLENGTTKTVKLIKK